MPFHIYLLCFLFYIGTSFFSSLFPRFYHYYYFSVPYSMSKAEHKSSAFCLDFWGSFYLHDTIIFPLLFIHCIPPHKNTRFFKIYFTIFACVCVCLLKIIIKLRHVKHESNMNILNIVMGFLWRLSKASSITCLDIELFSLQLKDFSLFLLWSKEKARPIE